jgi:acyl-coenzyme A thioesterase PaaI-like protein
MEIPMSKFKVDLGGEAGWQALSIPTSFGRGRSFVSGEPDGDRLRIRYFQPPEKDRLFARVWFGPGAEGPPNHAHGGSAAAVLDEVMGTACWMTGYPVLAAQITINFRASLPLEQVFTVEAWVDKVEGRKVRTVGRLYDEGGQTFTDGEGLFIEIEADRFKAIQEAGLKQPGGERFGTLVERAKNRR